MARHSTLSNLSELCTSITDPRINRRKLHSLESIITISVCAVICGAESWNDIEDFGILKKEFFESFLDLSNGIPSHDTFARVFSRINPEEFNNAFYEWQKSLHDNVSGDIIAIDGKTLRSSFDKASGKLPIHMVSAWSTRNKVVLSQTKVSEKSNEIKAVPKLLQILDLKDCIVTMDAMGCQKDHAKAIRDKEGDYVLALKGNQSGFHQEVIDFCNDAVNGDLSDITDSSLIEKKDFSHGRIEAREYYLIKDLSWSIKAKEWKDIKSIGIVRAKRTVDSVTSEEIRYYCTSVSDVRKFARAVRNHWGIENSLHWVLDVAFNEDKCRIRKDNAAENFALLRHIAINLLKQETTKKRGIRGKMKNCGWDTNYMMKVLLGI